MFDRSCCYLCGSKDIAFFYKRPDGLDIYRCNNCSFHFIKKLDFPLRDLYKSSYFKNDFGYEDYNSFPAINFLWQYAFVRLFSDDKIKKFLEVGCAYGKLLELLSLENRYEIKGIELVDEAVLACKNKGFNMVAGDASSIKNESDNGFDILFAGELIEHIEDPVNFFIEADRVTTDGGVIIFSTPNAGEKEGNWIGFNRSLEHISYFSKRSTLLALEKIFGSNNVSYINFNHHGGYDTAVVIIKKSGFSGAEKTILKNIETHKIGRNEKEEKYIPFIYGKFFDDNIKLLGGLFKDISNLLSKYYIATITNNFQEQLGLELSLNKEPINSVYWQLKAINISKRNLECENRFKLINDELYRLRSSRGVQWVGRLRKIKNVFKK